MDVKGHCTSGSLFIYWHLLAEILPAELKDKTLQEIMAWRKTGVNCIGIKDAEEKFIINPPEETLINSRMKVIVLGTRQQIEEMKGNVEHQK